MFEKLKSFLLSDPIFYGLVIVAVAAGSFALGRLSVADSAAPVAFKPPAENRVTLKRTNNPIAIATTTTSTSETSVVASKSGTKYHLPECPGAKQIKEANLIRFASKELAAAAGYTPAANCPGLKQ